MSQRKTTILHVEDDRSLQSLVRVALETIGGYAVHTAADAAEALVLAREASPDVLLLDLDLGRHAKNGIETLRALRELPGLAAVPVVFLTAVHDPAVEIELRMLGVREIVRKPFRPRPLVAAIDRILASKET